MGKITEFFRRTTTTTTVVEDLTPERSVPDFDFNYGFAGGDWDDSSFTDFEDDDDKIEVNVKVGDADRGTFTYADLDDFASAVSSYGSLYDNGQTVTLTVNRV